MRVEDMTIAEEIKSLHFFIFTASKKYSHKPDWSTQTMIFSGYWNIIVYGRKHSYRVYTKMLNEAMRWTAAIQGVIDSKTPIETPTLQLIRDIKVKLIVPLNSSPACAAVLTVTVPVLPSGEQCEPRYRGADVQEEPHPEIHPASTALPPAAPPIRRSHQL